MYCKSLIIWGFIFISLYQILYMKLLLVTIGLLALAFAGIAIKIWSKKDGKFAGTCASQNPYLNTEGEACGYCGKMPGEQECAREKSPTI